MISVIIPVFNHAHTLQKCLRSIEEQTYQPLEVIVVNDGSTDNFSETISRIKLLSKLDLIIVNQDNLGGPAARNRGFRESKGKFVIFWDADVVAVPTMLQKMYQALVANPDASYAYSRFKFGWKTIHSLPFDSDQLRQINFITATTLIRREDFPGWDESLKRFQDWDLWLTMLEQNKTGVLVPEILFTAEVGGRIGISRWLPIFVYRLPWKIQAVKDYERARAVIVQKHHLTS